MRLVFAARLLFVVGCAAMASVAAVYGAPAVESTYWPVAKYTSLEIAGRGEGYVEVHIYGVKLRPCRLLEISALVRAKGGIWKRAEINIDARPLQLHSRPSGWQSFGTWRMRPDGDRVRLTAWHECHGGWDTFTHLGEWPMVTEPKL